jgi:hypothetical protein
VNKQTKKAKKSAIVTQLIDGFSPLFANRINNSATSSKISDEDQKKKSALEIWRQWIAKDENQYKAPTAEIRIKVKRRMLVEDPESIQILLSADDENEVNYFFSELIDDLNKI